MLPDWHTYNSTIAGILSRTETNTMCIATDMRTTVRICIGLLWSVLGIVQVASATTFKPTGKCTWTEDDLLCCSLLAPLTTIDCCQNNDVG